MINDSGAIVGTATLTTTAGTTSHGVMLLPVDIEPDAGQSGTTGDLVPSIKGSSGQKHYVSPKQASSFVIVKAIVPSFADSNFSTFFEWDTLIVNPDGSISASVAGQAVSGSPDKWEIKRDTPGQYIARLKTIGDHKPVITINVWIVWCDSSPNPLGVILNSPRPIFTTGTTTVTTQPLFGEGISYTARINPVSICDKSNDIPNLMGGLETGFHADAHDQLHVIMRTPLGDPPFK